MLPESGQYAWRTAQLTAQLRKITIPGGEEWNLMDNYGTAVFEDLPPTSKGLASQDEQRPLPRRSSRGLPELDCGNCTSHRRCSIRYNRARSTGNTIPNSHVPLII